MELNLNIESKDIAFVKDRLKSEKKPVDFNTLLLDVAMYKTQNNRKSKVKIYNPDCEYKVGDLIYKEYKGLLPVGAKKNVEFDSGVVLKVTEVKTRFGLNEVKLDYEGTSLFRKYIKYLERQKIELLLPHKRSKPCEKVKYLEVSDDPRTQQAPMVEKDLNQLRKKLVNALSKIENIALIGNNILLEDNLKKIKADVFDRIKEFLQENKKSVSTEFLVENFVKVDAEDKDFDAYCFAFNYLMRRDHKFDFQRVSYKGWGKWNLITILYHLKKDSLVSVPNPYENKTEFCDVENLSQKSKTLEDEIFENDLTKYILTQREVESGALRFRPELYTFDDSIEITAHIEGTKKELTLYHYEEDNLLLGFKEYFKKIKALQGMMLTFVQKDDLSFSVSCRTSKKGTVADKVVYDKSGSCFVTQEKKVASNIYVNKACFLDPEVYIKIRDSKEEYSKLDSMNKLFHKVFLDFGIQEKNYEINVLKLYHILDTIFPVTFRTVLDMVLSNPEFIPSDKISGLFYLDSDAVCEIEEAELQRRAERVKDAKKHKADQKIKKDEEEDRRKEEVRLKREEHRRKREEEMRLKEKRAIEKSLDSAPSAQEEDVKAAFTGEFPPQSDALKKEQKKAKKKVEEDKPAKTAKKRIEKSDSSEDKINIDDIKNDIELEKLKEKVLEKKERKSKIKKKAVAYKDSGGFGGLLASKLDEIVSTDDKKK